MDVTGLAESAEREVKLSLAGHNVWMENQAPVRLRIAVEALPSAGDEGRSPGARGG